MKDYMLSQFIDDEMNVDEKIEFVETVHADRKIKDETVAFLKQEKRIRTRVIDRIPASDVNRRPRLNLEFWRPAVVFMSGLATALVIVFFAQPVQKTTSVPYRFVIYQPAADQVEITGSFTDWKTLPLKKMGASGYWEVTLNLSPDEHRYSYILEGGERIPDPTILTREQDDFGGENSILDISGRA